MNRKLLFSASAAALLGAAAAYVGVGSSPAQAGGGRPHFEFTPGEMTVAITGYGRDAASYYLPYTLKNPMDDARTPHIYVEVKTETGKTYSDRPDSKVVAAAQKSLKQKDLKTTIEVRSQELAAGGSAQAVANFGNIDPNADDITVRVYGLWDPIVRTRNGKVFSEKRVLVLQFRRYGDEYDRPMDEITLKSSKEEVEGEPVELYTTVSEKKK
jgi:hypothetical protein